jgi:predicted lactoylglutathione lyase
MHIVISLPIADRATSHAFYSAHGLEAVGEPASDGLPEPLQFAVNDGLHLMLIPRGGFGWVIGDRDAAAPGQIECVLSLVGDVDAVVARAHAAGAATVTEPAQQPWGYTGTFADPDGHLWMVTSEPA